MSDTTHTCRCTRPTRDAAYFCDECARSLSTALGDIAWLEDELDTTISRQAGVDYRTAGGTRGSERPSPVSWGASEARTHLRSVLVAWVLFCDQEAVRHQSATAGLPADTITAMSRWLMWRVDGLALHDIGSEAVDEITDAVAKCHRLIDSRPPRQYLGQCEACDQGRVYGTPGAQVAKCDTCGETIDADTVKRDLLAQLDDRLCTASEIAKLSTHLGLTAGREQVRKRVEYLARKDRIVRHGALEDVATYRFGEVYEHLMRDDNGKKVA